MAFAPISPLTLDGLPKYFSAVYHRWIEYTMFTFCELNLADRLIDALPDQGFTAQEIMNDERSNWNADILYRILRSCTDAGLVERINDDKHFILTESGRMLTSDHPSHARDLCCWIFGPLNTNAAHQLPNLVRNEGTGSGMARITGELDLYKFLSRPDQKDLLTTFTGAMTAFSMYTDPKLVTDIDFSRFTTLADIGGNCGTYLAQILEHYPTITHGIVFDLPHVIDRVKNGEVFQLRKIPENKYKYVAGDMFDSSTIPQTVAYVFKRVLHNFDDEKVFAIFSSIRKANQDRIEQSSVSIIIVDCIILPDGAMSNWQIHATDLAMIYAFGSARERTQQEFEQLLKKAGFELKALYPSQAPDSIIEAVLIK